MYCVFAAPRDGYPGAKRRSGSFIPFLGSPNQLICSNLFQFYHDFVTLHKPAKPPGLISRVSGYLFTWGAAEAPTATQTAVQEATFPTQVTKQTLEHFGTDNAILSPYMQGSVLLMLYEFVRSNSFFLDFVFYDHTEQCSSSGISWLTRLKACS